jgi:hypothetical protein
MKKTIVIIKEVDEHGNETVQLIINNNYHFDNY